MNDAERRAWLKNLRGAAMDSVIVVAHPYGGEETWSTPIPVEKTGAGKQYGFRVNGEWFDWRGQRWPGRGMYTSTWYEIRPVPTPEEYAEREAKRASEKADAIARKMARERINDCMDAVSGAIPTAALIEIAAAMPDCAAIIAKHKTAEEP